MRPASRRVPALRSPRAPGWPPPARPRPSPAPGRSPLALRAERPRSSIRWDPVAPACCSTAQAACDKDQHPFSEVTRRRGFRRVLWDDGAWLMLHAAHSQLSTSGVVCKHLTFRHRAHSLGLLMSFLGPRLLLDTRLVSSSRPASGGFSGSASPISSLFTARGPLQFQQTLPKQPRE